MKEGGKRPEERLVRRRRRTEEKQQTALRGLKTASSGGGVVNILRVSAADAAARETSDTPGSTGEPEGRAEGRVRVETGGRRVSWSLRSRRGTFQRFASSARMRSNRPSVTQAVMFLRDPWQFFSPTKSTPKMMKQAVVK